MACALSGSILKARSYDAIADRCARARSRRARPARDRWSRAAAARPVRRRLRPARARTARRRRANRRARASAAQPCAAPRLRGRRAADCAFFRSSSIAGAAIARMHNSRVWAEVYHACRKDATANGSARGPSCGTTTAPASRMSILDSRSNRLLRCSLPLGASRHSGRILSGCGVRSRHGGDVGMPWRRAAPTASDGAPDAGERDEAATEPEPDEEPARTHDCCPLSTAERPERRAAGEPRRQGRRVSGLGGRGLGRRAARDGRHRARLRAHAVQGHRAARRRARSRRRSRPRAARSTPGPRSIRPSITSCWRQPLLRHRARHPGRRAAELVVRSRASSSASLRSSSKR